jgi:competence ComEA-like helix-hairpin-helix protein
VQRGEAGETPGLPIRHGAEAIMAREQVMTGEPVDLNRASAEELIVLIGINESTAEGIIDFRDANGGFDTVEDLMEVECISESSYQRIRLKVTV